MISRFLLSSRRSNQLLTDGQALYTPSQVTHLANVAKLTHLPGYTFGLAICPGFIYDDPFCLSGIASMSAGLNRSTEILIDSPLELEL